MKKQNKKTKQNKTKTDKKLEKKMKEFCFWVFLPDNFMKLSRCFKYFKISIRNFWSMQPTSNAMFKSKISKSFLAIKIQNVYLI